MCLPISRWVIYERTCPHRAVSVQFLTKNGMTSMPHAACSPNLPKRPFFFVSPDEKVLKGKRFANVEEVKQKKQQKY